MSHDRVAITASCDHKLTALTNFANLSCKFAVGAAANFYV